MSMEMEILEPEAIDRRSDERRAFTKVTGALQKVSGQEAGDPALEAALNDNRRLWSILQDNLFQEDNLLPDSLKNQLITLANWVDGYTAKVIEGEGELDALISVNQTIMEGLA